MTGVLVAALLAAVAAAEPAVALAGADQPAQSIWRPMADGGVEHLQSGLRCPAQLGEYRLSQHRAFDPFGLDAGCSWRSSGTAITLYLTRTDKVLESYEMTKAALTQTSAALNPRLVTEEQLVVDGLEWRRAVFAFDGSARSDVWVAPLNGWTLKYRATYETTDETAVRARLSEVTHAVQESAGARLAVCARSKAPKRPGRLIDTKGLFSSPIMLAALLAQGAAPDEANVAEIIYCVDEPFQAEGKGFLLWRGVGRDGGLLQADRVTAMTLGPPPTLDLKLDAIGNSITETLSGRRQSRWIGKMSADGATSVYGFFDRRPSPHATIPLLAGVIAGEIRPLGGFDKDKATITVGVEDDK